MQVEESSFPSVASRLGDTPDPRGVAFDLADRPRSVRVVIKSGHGATLRPARERGTLRPTLDGPTPEQIERRAEIGLRLKEIRKSRGVRQGELADSVPTSRQTISAWETGKGAPNWDQVAKICEVLGCSADYLLRGEGVWFENAVCKERIRANSHEDTAAEVASDLTVLLTVTDASVREIHKLDAAALTREALGVMVEKFGQRGSDER